MDASVQSVVHPGCGIVGGVIGDIQSDSFNLLDRYHRSFYFNLKNTSILQASQPIHSVLPAVEHTDVLLHGCRVSA